VSIEVVGDIQVYNAFSPNGDGFNNVFLIQHIETIAETRSNHVSIYNRWGDVVFDIKDYNNTTRVFRGLSNKGEELTSGTYFYKIEFSGGKKMQTGYLTLRK
jgi:gliding motility-associated-like protein